MSIRTILFLAAAGLFMQSCQKQSVDNGPIPQINFIFKFDSTQVRLNGLGQPAVMPAGNKGQSPRFNGMTAHYVELTKDALTALGGGSVLYHAAEVNTGGAVAIDFSKSSPVGNNQVFLSIPISSLSPGSYNWLRVSLAYQNYDIKLNAAGQTFNATVASFIGYRSYINSFKIKDSTLAVNANKDQGFWAFEVSSGGSGLVRFGQAPPGATTVPNPIFATSPIPAGSRVVTGQLSAPLVITGTETGDINIEVSLSTNKSFEWIDADGNDTYDPLNGDAVMDMGIRGMIPHKL